MRSRKSEWKKSEAGSGKSEVVSEEISAIIENIAEAITVIGDDYTIKWMNKAARDLLRKANAPATSRMCYQCHHKREEPCDDTEYPCPLKKLRHSGEPFTVEHKHFLPNGETRFFEILCAPVRSRDGTFQGIIEAQRDITERKRTEEALRESEETVRLLLSSAAEAIYGLDAEGHCIFCNPACLRFLGYEKEEDLLGKNMHTLIHHTRPEGTDYPIEECRIYEVIRKGKGIHVNDGILWRSDGSGFHAEYWAYPIQRGGQVCGVVVTFTDITERREAEVKLKKLTDELKRSNRGLEEFAYVASHDLQSPLLSAQSSLKLLARRLRGILDKESSEMIGYTQDRLSDMMILIKNLLKYSRVKTSSDKFKLTSGETILKQTLDNLKFEIENSGTVVTHDDLPEIMGDTLLLVQVFQNLISNAIKYRGRRPLRIHISAERKETDWVFSVKDNGIGIADEHTGRIFEIFHRIRERSRYTGTGIGLSTCKKIIELHGGHIWVKSEKGKGSTFFFTIPDRVHDHREMG